MIGLTVAHSHPFGLDVVGHVSLVHVLAFEVHAEQAGILKLRK